MSLSFRTWVLFPMVVVCFLSGTSQAQPISRQALTVSPTYAAFKTILDLVTAHPDLLTSVRWQDGQSAAFIVSGLEAGRSLVPANVESDGSTFPIRFEASRHALAAWSSLYDELLGMPVREKAFTGFDQSNRTGVPVGQGKAAIRVLAAHGLRITSITPEISFSWVSLNVLAGNRAVPESKLRKVLTTLRAVTPRMGADRQLLWGTDIRLTSVRTAKK